MRIKRFAFWLSALPYSSYSPFLRWAFWLSVICFPGRSVANIVGWCNGSTRGSEPRDGGSNPSPATNVVHHVQII